MEDYVRMKAALEVQENLHAHIEEHIALMIKNIGFNIQVKDLDLTKSPFECLIRAPHHTGYSTYQIEFFYQ